MYLRKNTDAKLEMDSSGSEYGPVTGCFEHYNGACDTIERGFSWSATQLSTLYFSPCALLLFVMLVSPILTHTRARARTRTHTHTRTHAHLHTLMASLSCNASHVFNIT